MEMIARRYGKQLPLIGDLTKDRSQLEQVSREFVEHVRTEIADRGFELHGMIEVRAGSSHPTIGRGWSMLFAEATVLVTPVQDLEERIVAAKRDVRNFEWWRLKNWRKRFRACRLAQQEVRRLERELSVLRALK